MGRNDPKLERWQWRVIKDKMELERGEYRCGYCGEIMSPDGVMCSGCSRSTLFIGRTGDNGSK